MSEPASTPNVRLGRDVEPVHYKLTIKTDLLKRTFGGIAEITIRVAKRVPSIVLNTASPLVLQSALLSHQSDKDTPVRAATALEFDQKKERVEITFAEGPLEAGEFVLGLRWEGSLEATMTGYFFSTFPSKEAAESMSLYSLTMLESTAARKVFVSSFLSIFLS